MKTSVIDVQDMLSVLSVDELEKRIVEVPGVNSATVNFAAENVTVRFDETRIEIADIKSAVRQRGYSSDKPEESKAPPEAKASPGAPPPGASHEGMAMPSPAPKPQENAKAAVPTPKPTDAKKP